MEQSAHRAGGSKAASRASATSAGKRSAGGGAAGAGRKRAKGDGAQTSAAGADRLRECAAERNGGGCTRSP